MPLIGNTNMLKYVSRFKAGPEALGDIAVKKTQKWGTGELKNSILAKRRRTMKMHNLGPGGPDNRKTALSGSEKNGKGKANQVQSNPYQSKVTSGYFPTPLY